VVITATQMLESMINSPSPTRAEVSDVSNAIFDGTDALMLSGETAVGGYPCEAVAFMSRIAEQVEERLDAERLLARRPFLPEVSDAVAHAACVTAHEINANALVCLTRSGLTARLVSRYRPRCPVIAVSPEESTVRRLAVQWGVIPVYSKGELEGEALVGGALVMSRTLGLVGEGDRVVITAGIGSGELRGKTNLIRVEVL
jgi:pyruvate kinase